MNPSNDRPSAANQSAITPTSSFIETSFDDRTLTDDRAPASRPSALPPNLVACTELTTSAFIHWLRNTPSTATPVPPRIAQTVASCGASHTIVMHLLSLPDDALYDVIRAVLKRHTDSNGIVYLGHAAHDVATLCNTHPRLHRIVSEQLGAVLIDSITAPELLQLVVADTLVIHGDVGALDALQPRELRYLKLDAVTTIPEAFICAHTHSLSELVIIGGTCAIPNEISLDLRRLTLAGAQGVDENALERLLIPQLTVIDLSQDYSTATVVARNCRQLETLILGNSDTDAERILSACVASAGTLQKLQVHARRDGDRSIFNEFQLMDLVRQCPRLSDVDVGPLPMSVVSNVLGHRSRTIYVRDWAGALPTSIQPTTLDWSSSATNAHLVSLLHPQLQELRLCMPPADNEVMHVIAANTGALQRLSLTVLPDVSTEGLAAVLAANGTSLTHFAVGPKCRRLSNVALMQVLANHCDNLQVVTFPRWGRPVESAVARFRNAAPFASIRAATIMR